MNFIRRKRAPDAGLVTALGLAAPSELADAGYTHLQIMEMGNWSNAEMVSRYIRNIDAGKKAMTKFMREALDE